MAWLPVGCEDADLITRFIFGNHLHRSFAKSFTFLLYCKILQIQKPLFKVGVDLNLT